MAKLVLAAGVPHPPRLVREMQDAPGQLRGEALFKQVAGYFEAAAPDVIIELDSDHLGPNAEVHSEGRRQDGQRTIGLRA